MTYNPVFARCEIALTEKTLCGSVVHVMLPNTKYTSVLQYKASEFLVFEIWNCSHATEKCTWHPFVLWSGIGMMNCCTFLLFMYMQINKIKKILTAKLNSFELEVFNNFILSNFPSFDPEVQFQVSFFRGERCAIPHAHKYYEFSTHACAVYLRSCYDTVFLFEKIIFENTSRTVDCRTPHPRLLQQQGIQ